MDELYFADSHTLIKNLQVILVIALTSIPSTSETHGCIRAVGESAMLSMIAREIINTSCPFPGLRNFHVIVSIVIFPNSPRQVKKQDNPNNVYVSPDTETLVCEPVHEMSNNVAF